MLCLTNEQGVEGWAEFTIAAPSDEIEQRIRQIAARFDSRAGKMCSDNFADLLADWRAGTVPASADQAFWDSMPGQLACRWPTTYTLRP